MIIFPYLLPNFFNGLETAIFSFLIYYILKEAFSVEKDNPVIYTVVLSAALTMRFDSFICLLPLLIFETIQIFRGKGNLKFRNLGIAFFTSAIIFSANYLFTGYLVPLSFEHKLDHNFNTETLFDYLRLYFLIIFPLLISYIFIKSEKSKVYKAYQCLLGSIFYIYISVFYSFFVEWMYYRYVFPFFFALFLIFLLNVLKKEIKTSGILYPVFIYFLFLFSILMPDSYQYVSGYRISGMPAVRDLTDILKESKTDEKYRIVASADAGYIPYKSEWKFLDLKGLTTPEVLHDRIGNVVKKINPTVLVISCDLGPEFKSTLISQYQNGNDSVPDNYFLVNDILLTNKYFEPDWDYTYYIYLNENADPELIEKLGKLSVNADEEMGYQKYVYLFFKNLNDMIKL